MQPPLVANLKCSSITYKKYFSCDCYSFRCCISLNTLNILSIFDFIFGTSSRECFIAFLAIHIIFCLFCKKKKKAQSAGFKKSPFLWGTSVLSGSPESAYFLFLIILRNYKQKMGNQTSNMSLYIFFEVCEIRIAKEVVIFLASK